MRIGFFFAVGVAALVAVAFLVRRLGEAALAVITPFVIGTALALLLDPLVNKMTRRGLGRGLASGIVFLVFLAFLVGIGWLTIPRLIEQAQQLAENGPEYVGKVQTFTKKFLESHHTIGGVTLPESVSALSQQLSERTSMIVRSSAGRIGGFLLGSVGTLLEIVVALIVAFYMLLDLDRLRARLFYLLPERRRALASQIGNDVGGVFSDYLRGLLIVCALYGVATIALLYGLSLFPDGHGVARYALLLGAAAGILYAVPYIGALATSLVTFLVCFAAGGLPLGLWGIGLTLLLNQVFDNVVTPKVVGGGVGLHPVASLFSLTLGGALFGLPGLLLSVPIAASVQVILFRLFPKLQSPTPPAFLRAQGVRPGEEKSAEILGGQES